MRFRLLISFVLIITAISIGNCIIQGDIDNYYATNATGPLNIPSYVQYEGVNEIVHPDVIYKPEGWNGYQYWMAYTPFPNNTEMHENPCIAVSNDNVTWIDPPGFTNPVDSYASGPNDYYSDPELIMSPDQQTMYLLWRRYQINTAETLYVRSSTDGVNWTTKIQTLITNPNVESLISPAIVYNGTDYMLWTVNTKISPRTVNLRTSSSIYGPWSTSTITDIQPLTVDTLGHPLTETWHINVTKIENEYWMINNDTVIGGYNGLNLYLGKSLDGIHWTFANHPVMYQRNNYVYWDQKLYRASMIPIYDGQQMGLRIWYSVMRKATNQNPPWRIGYTEAWCAPKNTRLTSTRQDSVTITWDGFATAYLKNTTYKVQSTGTPFIESSWQDATTWSSNLSYTFLRSSFNKQFYRVKAKIE